MKILTLLLLCLSLNSYALYESDDRKNLFEVTKPELKKIASAIAYQVDKHDLRGWTFNRYWKLVMKPFRDRGICREEKFSNELSMRAGCTGILVSPKHLLTAGNCITAHYCKNDLYYWMFDYNLKSDLPFDYKHHNKNFYQCKKIIKRVYDPSSAMSYTLLELEKEVKGVEPVKLSKSNSLSPDDELYVFGHVNGLPLKISGNAFVSDQDEKHFILNSDISGETKGAAIVNAKTHAIEGIMIYGTKNYDYSGQGCKSAVIYENHEAQELALKASALHELIENL